MSRYLLDTDTLTLIQFGHAAAVQNLAAHAIPRWRLRQSPFKNKCAAGWRI